MLDGWKLLNLVNGGLQLEILPGVGGRLWDIKYFGHSLLFQNTELMGKQFDVNNLSNIPSLSPQFNFPLWGGEKTWIAPDTAWVDGAPFPVLDSGCYLVLLQNNQKVLMQSQQCPISNLTVQRTFTLNSEHQWTIEHNVINCGTKPRDTGIWSVMMIKTPATIGIVMKLPKHKEVFGNSEGILKKNSVGLLAQCDRKQEMKIGLQNPDGKALIKQGNTGPWLACTVQSNQPGAIFAHGRPLEIFNSGDYPYCEAEWHSPMKRLAPGEKLTFQQVFNVWNPGSRPPGLKMSALNEELMSCMS